MEQEVSKAPNQDELLKRIPILGRMDTRDPKFLQLCNLLNEVAQATYHPQRKYELMYKVQLVLIH